MIKLVCFNNKCRKGHGYLKDATFKLTIGKTYDLTNAIPHLNPEEDFMEAYITMLDDDGNLINLYIIRNHFETIEQNRDRKLKELGI
jgi:hypothetical protein